MNDGEETEDFDRDLALLIGELEATVRLLERVGESRWADWLNADLAGLREGRRSSLDHLLRAFGGMGSLNDLYLHPRNGHDLSESDVVDLNEQLARRTGAFASLARQLERSLR